MLLKLLLCVYYCMCGCQIIWARKEAARERGRDALRKIPKRKNCGRCVYVFPFLPFIIHSEVQYSCKIFQLLWLRPIYAA